ncbi:hypothetical protein GOBAR_DD26763 [Gossypium barbadense]|nr:hypothetical protein GOBAR_DD26763 [Gossypium barbadense]
MNNLAGHARTPRALLEAGTIYRWRALSDVVGRMLCALALSDSSLDTSGASHVTRIRNRCANLDSTFWLLQTTAFRSGWPLKSVKPRRPSRPRSCNIRQQGVPGERQAIKYTSVSPRFWQLCIHSRDSTLSPDSAGRLETVFFVAAVHHRLLCRCPHYSGLVCSMSRNVYKEYEAACLKVHIMSYLAMSYAVMPVEMFIVAVTY